MISLDYSSEDILKSSEFSVLVHICNAYEDWDTGIGKKLKSIYSYAYYTFDIHCNGQGYVVYDSSSDDMCLLIPPCEFNKTLPKHWIACLLIGSAYRKNNTNRKFVLDKLEEMLKQLIDDVVLQYLDGAQISTIRFSENELSYLGIDKEDLVKIVNGISLSDLHTVAITLHTE